MEIVKHIAEISLFNGLSPSQIDELAMICIDQEIERNQFVFAEGDEGVGFYVVISGRVKIFKVSPDGKEQILHIFSPGEHFAEVAVFSGTQYPANAETIEKSRLFFFPKKEFIFLIKKNPSLAMNMMAALSLRLKSFSHMIEALSLKEVPGRLAGHLLYLNNQIEAQADEVKLDMAKVQLASLLGTIPETLSRILTKMNKQGYIESRGAVIKILNREALQDLADGEARLV